MVESAVIFLLFLMLVLGFLDLSIATFRKHMISEAARHVARQTIVHGSRATVKGSWGPATIGPIAATDANPLVQAANDHLSGIDPSLVTVKAEWLDGGNDPGDRARITITVEHQPIMTYVFGSEPLQLQARSVMTITH